VQALYEEKKGEYWYKNGYHVKAFIAFIVGIIITVPLALIPVFSAVAAFSWPIGVLITGIVYGAIMRSEQVAASTEFSGAE